jgi:hypothetical protein
MTNSAFNGVVDPKKQSLAGRAAGIPRSQSPFYKKSLYLQAIGPVLPFYWCWGLTAQRPGALSPKIPTN